MTTTSARPPASQPPATPRPRAAIGEKTLRKDRWWLMPLVTVVCFTLWLAYGVGRAMMQKYYFAEGPGYHYLTPFYSPCVSDACDPNAAEFGRFIPRAPLLPFAILSLPFLLLFRLTCYYYRKAYYRSFWASPPACAVPDGHAKYTGETRFPLLFQNLHRYFVYCAVIISVINTVDAVESFHGTDGFGIGLGNLVIVGNVVLLWIYTLSCHSCRHIAGGRLRHFSKHPVRYRMWMWISKLNAHHMMWAWITLGTLVLTDFYIMAVAANWFSDPRLIG